MELQLPPLGRRGLAALAPHSGESILDIGCGGDETALELVRAVAPDGTSGRGPRRPRAEENMRADAADGARKV
jgi:hypothetical protein